MIDKATKLYNVPRSTWIVLSEDAKVTDMIYFDHIDGMYSYCLCPNGDLVHISANTEVYPLDFSRPWETLPDGHSKR